MDEEVKILSEEELKDIASKGIAKVSRLENQLSELQMVLSGDERFQNFLKLQKAVADKSEEVKKNLEKQMIESNIKTIDLVNWGKITIVDRHDIKVTDINKIPKKFLKYTVTREELATIEKELGRKVLVDSKQVDMDSLKSNIKLSNKVPNGAEKKLIQYIKMSPTKEKKEVK